MTLAILQGILAFFIAFCAFSLGIASAIGTYQNDPNDFRKYQSIKEFNRKSNILSFYSPVTIGLIVIAGVLTYAAQQ